MPRNLTARSYGPAKVQARLRSRRTLWAAGVERGIKKASAFLLREAKKIVPVDTGALKASGRIDLTGTGPETNAFITFSTDYAGYVHEDLNAYHRPPTSAKYLERPAREHQEEIRQIVRDECRREAGRL